MKQVRSTIVLMVLFFAGLLGLWGLDRWGMPTGAQRRAGQQRVLPAMADLGELGVRRVEIDRDGKQLVFERRGPARWQMVRPMDVAADPAGVDALIRNLKELRRSPDAGAVSGPAESFGLDHPAAVIRLFGGSESGDREIAALEVGKTLRGVTYVRAAGSSDVDVVDGKLAASLDRSPTSWREVNLVPTPSFQATGLTVTRGGMTVKAERSAAGRWNLTTPLKLPADGPRIESLLAALSAVRVLGEGGFAADDVKDFAPYGLDRPEATLEVDSPAQAGGPLVLAVGKKVPGHDDRVYVRRGDQDDVVEVSDRFVREIPREGTALRSQSVADFNPGAVREIRVDAMGTTFRIERRRDGWRMLAPRDEKADTFLVQSFLNQLAGLKASEFLAADRVAQPGLDPPALAIRLWEGGPAEEGTTPAVPQGPPSFSLRLGRHDVLRKTMYGRLDGDDVILALPDAMLDKLPRSKYAFRDRGVLAISPATVSRLTVSRPGLTAVVEPDRTSSSPNQWKMVSPVKAPADVRAVTQILGILSDLRAEDFAGDVEAVPSFGLDKPGVSLAWELDPQAAAAAAPEGAGADAGRKGRLDVGKPAAGKPGAFYASLEGRPFVFVLPAAAIEPLGAELRDTAIFSTTAADVRRLVFRLPGRTLAFSRRTPPKGDPSDWSPEAGTDMAGIDLSRFNDLVAQVSRLHAQRFLQYDGPIPDAAGLARPRLEIELRGDPARPPEVLRLGRSEGGVLAAAAGRSASGAVFALPAAAWDALIESLSSRTELPRSPFAP
ncbi:hypothetical protein OJF2_13320 [Aquisphaera giovannonii]|uniref:DUF4340 domain-containing protein n=1 Tax=Aquisphaera giovannonii TaxID=406548 RepID=A0A5B9VX58_9BACT|nr:DUF4340 domain-containing protein [Aquisphaera giovannonii]QEH32848.1 hypothetical protein OJF2_13320 [Aquisphaera giovannonii]